MTLSDTKALQEKVGREDYGIFEDTIWSGGPGQNVTEGIGPETFSDVAFAGTLFVDFGRSDEDPLDKFVAKAGIVVAHYAGEGPGDGLRDFHDYFCAKPLCWSSGM